MKRLEELADERKRLREELAVVEWRITGEIERIQREESRSMTKAAQVLGVSRQALYKMLGAPRPTSSP